MICKSCGHSIEKGWKYCTNCSKKVTNNKLKIIGIIALTLLFLIIAFFIVKSNEKVDEKYLKRYLQDRYSEKFTDVHLVKSIANPDLDLSCDGSSFGKIKGEGMTEYYKIYSTKNDIEFFVYYDTSDKSKTINDTYEKYLKRRTTIKEAYEISNKYLDNYINSISISYDSEDKLKQINSISQLNEILSKFDDNYIKEYDKYSKHYKDKMYIYINEDIYDFCKNNYLILTNLNSEITSLRENYNFSMFIKLNNDARIELGRTDGKVYVFDKKGLATTSEEKLENFVMREER